MTLGVKGGERPIEEITRAAHLWINTQNIFEGRIVGNTVEGAAYDRSDRLVA
jgi:hypothetical protein